MQTSPEHPPETVALSCDRCGYLLRGLDASGRCPECGLEIATSLAARGRRGRTLATLRAALVPPPKPLPALARNDRAWLWTAAVAAVSLALLPPALALWQRWRESIPWQQRVPEYPLLALTAWFAAAVWLLTRRDRPAPPHPCSDPSYVRLWLRVLSLSPAAAAALAAVSEVVPAADHGRYAILATELFILTPAVLFLLFDYLAYLAARAWAPRAAVLFRACMLAVTPFLAATALLATLSGRSYSTEHERYRYPEVVAEAVAWVSVAPMAVGGVVVICAGLVGLGVTIWRLPEPSGLRRQERGVGSS